MFPLRYSTAEAYIHTHPFGAHMGAVVRFLARVFAGPLGSAYLSRPMTMTSLFLREGDGPYLYQVILDQTINSTYSHVNRDPDSAWLQWLASWSSDMEPAVDFQALREREL